VRPYINALAKQYLSNHSTCKNIPIPPTGNIVDLLTSPFLAWVRQFLQEHVTVKILNTMIDKWAHSQSGEWGGLIRVAGSLIGGGGVDVNIPQLGHLMLDVGNLTVSGLDTIGSYALMAPSLATEVTNQSKSNYLCSQFCF
jgi:hypothetical protein